MKILSKSSRLRKNLSPCHKKPSKSGKTGSGKVIVLKAVFEHKLR